jgi:hypothetical protein
MTVAIAALFLLPDFPHNTRWLSVEERELAQRRLAEDASEVVLSLCSPRRLHIDDRCNFRRTTTAQRYRRSGRLFRL